MNPSIGRVEELYDAEPCARFFSDVIEYQALKAPTELPRELISPKEVVKRQKGTCFDLATLLCTVLIGDGYDAVVVTGYASQAVCEDDRTGQPIPQRYLTHVTALEDAKALDAPRKVVERISTDRYRQQPRPSMESRFVAKQRMRAEKIKRGEDPDTVFQEDVINDEMAEARALAAAHGMDTETPTDTETDPLAGQRVHAWVAVLSGGRGVTAPYFIEPATGDVVPIDSDEYLGVESVFNNENFFINQQDCTQAGIARMSWDLTSKGWEPVLPQPTTPEPAPGIGMSQTPFTPFTPSQATEGPASTFPEHPGFSIGKVQPWADVVVVDEETIERRFPGGRKTVTFSDGRVDLFGAYVEDSGVLRIVTTDPTPIMRPVIEDGVILRHEETGRVRWTEAATFDERRADGLTVRSVVYIQDGAGSPAMADLTEVFQPGRPDQLAKHALTPGQERVFTFYSGARPDALAALHHRFGRSFGGLYAPDRQDLLRRRKAVLGPEGEGLPLEVGGETASVAALVDKFHPAPVLMADAAVLDDIPAAKRYALSRTPQMVRYNMGTKDVHVTLHCHPGRIFPATLSYDAKTGDVSRVEPNHLAPTLLTSEVDALLTPLISDGDKAALQSVRDLAHTMASVTSSLEESSANPTVAPTVYEPERRGVTHQTGAGTGEVEAGRDYLTPFLPVDFDEEEGLDAETVQRVRQKCLTALKERVLRRAGVIQARLDAENQKLAKQQAAFRKNAQHMDKDEEAQYVERFNEALFRVRVLESRLKRHEKGALRKYAELDARLAADPRLTVEDDN